MKFKFLNNKIFIVAGTIIMSAYVFGCGGNYNKSKSDSAATSTTDVKDANTLLGAGSTFVYPLFSKMFAEYDKQAGIRINYQSIGSGGGILQLTNKTIDFGDSDAPLNDGQTKTINANVLHIPMCSGAVVISYNLPDLKGTLKLDPDVLANIFLGKITKWNDERISKLNPGLQLPATSIFIAHRSDGSGTTNIFTTYLAKVSNDWNKSPGKGSSINWPVGLGGKGNEGVAGLVKQTPGAIGYIELAYAKQNKMAFADIKNKSGNFITPTVASTSAAGNITMPADAKASLSNTDAKDGYPISGLTWALIYKEQNYNQRSKDRAEKVIKLLWWNIHDGQKYCNDLNYAPLSAAAVTVAEKILKSATFDGKPIM
ncbi:phosphate ABC transporter substrate-binding protein PstS [Mucilaginibacter sp.]|uniref:phosphate ABC transporter substrate-binding protein PstS n=1 Tax=Mucilaginibacter sp. TaxID=1882438 RepID=UPI00261024A3|nr:phosphate ABC transporter substrate-binding protein PstS [Mucilaginibacter sp.]MDB5030952.1 phosphate transport system substrate-binding protein [Mucilaginibacter sp.]